MNSRRIEDKQQNGPEPHELPAREEEQFHDGEQKHGAEAGDGNKYDAGGRILLEAGPRAPETGEFQSRQLDEPAWIIADVSDRRVAHRLLARQGIRDPRKRPSLVVDAEIAAAAPVHRIVAGIQRVAECRVESDEAPVDGVIVQPPGRHQHHVDHRINDKMADDRGEGKPVNDRREIDDQNGGDQLEDRPRQDRQHGEHGRQRERPAIPRHEGSEQERDVERLAQTDHGVEDEGRIDGGRQRGEHRNAPVGEQDDGQPVDQPDRHRREQDIDEQLPPPLPAQHDDSG